MVASAGAVAKIFAAANRKPLDQWERVGDGGRSWSLTIIAAAVAAAAAATAAEQN